MKKTSMLHQKLWLLLIPVLLLASILRVYRLDTVPPSPYWEEVALGYDAYSIAKTGKDHQGNAYPLIAFPSFGDYKPSGYFYAIVPFLKLFDLSVWAVRLPSAIAGIVSVALVYGIAKKLFDEKVGLTASLFFAVQPWAIHFSRGGWEVNLALCLLLFGTWLLLLAKEKVWTLIPAVLFFCLSMYTYHAARLFAPLIGGLGGIWILWNWRRPSLRQFLILGGSVLLLVVFLYPLLVKLQDKSVSSRFSDTSIFSNLQPIVESNTAIEAHGNTRMAKLIYHRYWYFGKIIASQWASHFTPQFLFIRGDGNYRHGGWTGLLFPTDSVFILVALALLLVGLFEKNSKLQITNIKKVSKHNFQILGVLFWIVVAAIAPALVTPAPHALRFLFAAPAFSLLGAVGLWTLIEFLQKKTYTKALLFGAFLIYLFFFSRYYSLYLVTYPVRAASDWQYGYEELYAWITNNTEQGEDIYITRDQGRPAMYYLFYSKYDPTRIQQAVSTLPKDQLELLQVGTYHFVDAITGAERGIIATSGTRVVPGGKIIHNIPDPQDNIIWVIWRR